MVRKCSFCDNVLIGDQECPVCSSNEMGKECSSCGKKILSNEICPSCDFELNSSEPEEDLEELNSKCVRCGTIVPLGSELCKNCVESEG